MLGHGHNVLSGVRQIYRALPGHDSEDVEREQYSGGMDLGIGAIEEVGNHFRTLFFRMIGLIIKLGILLIALGWKADVVELNFIDSRLGYELGEGDVIVLNLGIRGIGPDQLAVFTPRLAGAMRFHRQFSVSSDQVLIAEDGDTRDRMHVLGMQKMNQLRKIGNVMALSGG